MPADTRPRQSPSASDLQRFLDRFRARLVVLDGPAKGLEFVIDQREVRVGRGPGVDLALDDPSLERDHARLRFTEGAFQLEASAPALLNRHETTRATLKAEDRLQLGDVAFVFTVDPR